MNGDTDVGGERGHGEMNGDTDVGGDRYDASVAAAIANNKFGYYLPYYRMQDIFASVGWTPSRSTLDNIMDGLEFVIQPLIDLMWKRALSDVGVGIDDTNVTLLMPNALPSVNPDDTPEQQLKTQRLIEKMLEAQGKFECQDVGLFRPGTSSLQTIRLPPLYLAAHLPSATNYR